MAIKYVSEKLTFEERRFLVEKINDLCAEYGAMEVVEAAVDELRLEISRNRGPVHQLGDEEQTSDIRLQEDPDG